ncbi:MAG: UDP-N-acetylmuramate--L-alanine ligase [Spirochaetaceae bacterium]|jgi:UDP-N-acetylmuramate--alanine ligase|nr:UDP-N-acetylmuramate--L-alanine ligase [Spirochaetaceae bacterium]
MQKKSLPDTLQNFYVHMIGIKGTGMAALAELLYRRGAIVTGSDIDEKFYTDEILQRLNIPYNESFSADNISDSIQLVIHSSAYGNGNSEMESAKNKNLPIMEYTEALGYISSLSESFGIAGVHGKTTTTALAGTLAGAVKLEASVLVGSAVPTFDGFSTAYFGDKYFIAETCEYQRHFLRFHPSSIILTSIEPDHLDYFKDYNDILDAYISYISLLPEGGDLIYCSDDPGAVEAAKIIGDKREDIHMIPYGERAEGLYRIMNIEGKAGLSSFRLSGFNRSFSLRIPGKHLILDAVAAMALILRTLEKEGKEISENITDVIAKGLLSFAGCKRRSEILGESEGILFIDDYGHHPTAIRMTLEGFKNFYPGRRLIIDFMSHTFSRTAALLDEFSKCFGAADVVILHKIYASAREVYTGTVNGRDLFEKTKENKNEVYYFEGFSEAEDFYRDFLKEGDLFLTMGAGNNWQIGKNLLHELKELHK